ncbi:hypothetical protein SAMN04487792_1667 [Lactobacillus bombicola]|uniref:Uncharacterized protein n=1 Tax=Lactobacillus bombicola TaxID=1505723 RepID=A0A1I1U0Q8_9LACO|nr:hypothetical protein [Lactobacillus bombicola]SFD63178.1 hypothetical protein SAMN04487792_1667 [Lactobacillus bombicola]
MYTITLKNKSEVWEDVYAANCIQYLIRYNGLTEKNIVKALSLIIKRMNLDINRLQVLGNIGNIIYWIFNYNNDIEVLENKNANSDILQKLKDGQRNLIKELLLDVTLCDLVLNELAKIDSKIILKK